MDEESPKPAEAVESQVQENMAPQADLSPVVNILKEVVEEMKGLRQDIAQLKREPEQKVAKQPKPKPPTTNGLTITQMREKRAKVRDDYLKAQAQKAKPVQQPQQSRPVVQQHPQQPVATPPAQQSRPLPQAAPVPAQAQTEDANQTGEATRKTNQFQENVTKLLQSYMQTLSQAMGVMDTVNRTTETNAQQIEAMQAQLRQLNQFANSTMQRSQRAGYRG